MKNRFYKRFGKVGMLSLFLIMGVIPVMGQKKTASQINKELNGKSADGYKLVWHDEFNEKVLDTTKWNYEVNGNGGGNNELQYYTDSPKNSYLKDGNLVIIALKEEYKGKEYTSARINTKGKETWKYGRFEMRAKLPSGRGSWPAFWLLGEDIGTVGWPACGEVDIMENVGFDPLWVHGSIHTPSSYGNTVNHGKIKVADCFSAYHIYGVTWTPEKVEFYIDDPSKPYYTYDPKDKNAKTWPFDKPMFVIINLAIGGGWGGMHGVDNTIFPQKYYIDWVRVYRH